MSTRAETGRCKTSHDFGNDVCKKLLHREARHFFAMRRKSACWTFLAPPVIMAQCPDPATLLCSSYPQVWGLSSPSPSLAACVQICYTASTAYPSLSKHYSIHSSLFPTRHRPSIATACKAPGFKPCNLRGASNIGALEWYLCKAASPPDSEMLAI